MRRVSGAVGRAVSTFNEGTSAIVAIMNSMWVDVSTTTLDQLRAIDARRVARSEAASTPSMKEARREASKRKLQIIHDEEEREEQTYGAGMAD